ncbi:hypothetical protein N9J37_00815 [Pontimonas sp.]|nr:hypothetical protein [Pontimonas sp.]MDA9116837.1 hypothetical protein [Pontimonas sp.]
MREFPKSQIFILVFDEWPVNIYEYFTHVCKFLDIDPTHKFTSDNFNKSGGRYFRATSRNSSEFRVPDDLRAAARARLPGEVLRVEQHLGRIIQAWNNV